MRLHDLRVRQTGGNHLYVNIFPAAGTITANHVGTGPHNWAWEIECNLCGATLRNQNEWMNRLDTEVKMLNHAGIHLNAHVYPNGGPDAGFGGYGWEKP